MFKARPTRTLLTVLGMGVGIGAVLFLVALGYGIQRAMLETITTSDSLLSLDVYSGGDKKNITAGEAQDLKNISGVDLVSPVLETPVQVEYGGFTTDSKVMAVEPVFFDLDGMKMAGGSKLNDQDPEGLIITATFAKIFGKAPEEMLGEEIKIFMPDTDVKNQGSSSGYVYSGESRNFHVTGFSENKENMAYFNLKKVDGDDLSYSRLKIKCQSDDVVAKVRETIAAKNFSVSALSDIIEQVNKVFAVVRVVLGFFGLIALLVSAIGMFNTMTVTLLERTEEIGIMKSIGASKGDILIMFVFEATIMGFLGGICGIILGLATAAVFNFIVNLIAGHFGGMPVSLFYFPLWFLGVILFSGALVGFFTGLVPAKKAGSTDPLDALRYK